MEKNKPNDSQEISGEKNEGNPSRDDSGNQNYNRNDKEKRRRRIVRVEKNPRSDETFDPSRERKSFNPNFTKDNYKRDDRNRWDSNRDNRGRNDSSSSSRYDRNNDSNRSDSNNNKEWSRDSRSSNDRNSDRKSTWSKDNNRQSDRQSSSYRDNDRFQKREGGYGNRDNKPYRQSGEKRQFGGGNRDYNGSDRRQDGFRRNDNAGKFTKRTDNRRQQPRTYDSESYPKFPRPKIEEPIRLNRYLAMSGICSRREADELIASGIVSVNGVVVTELGTKILPTDIVKHNGEVARGENKVYIVMNKPKGFVTTLEDPHADKTVMDLLKNACKERIYPVGRLDKNSLGVLLVTNDGDLTTKLTHPAYNKKKIYQVALDKALTKADMQQITDGIELEDGLIQADQVNYVDESRKNVGIEIHSGRNRIVRRIFEHLGYKVMKLDRVYFAGLTKKNLKRGAWRFLTAREVDALLSGRYE